MAAFLEVEFTVTLMRLTEVGYVESGDRLFVYYFAAPDAWASLPEATLQSRAFAVAERMYSETNERLRAAEPSDPNYLRAKSTRARVLSAEEASARPWAAAGPPVWDPSACVVVDADGSFTRVSRDDLAGAAPAERGHVRLDRVLPGLLAKHVPACVAVYGQLYEQFQDSRPLDEPSRNVWGAAVIFFCMLDRLATGGEYEDPFATVEEMITWLAEGGEVPRDDVESARQIYHRLFEYNVFRPNDTLFQMVYERAWHIRYSDLEIGRPSAFQGFIHCLTGCRETLHRFDFDDPRRAPAAPRSPVFEKIAAFHESAVVPAFAEIKATLERHGKRVFIAENDRIGDEFLEQFYREVHGPTKLARELESSAPSDDEIASGRARYLGYSLVAVDAEPAESRYGGIFFETIVYIVGPNDQVWASPFVFYHMKFDNKLHGFAHRFDNNQERQAVETIDKYAVQNHFLNAYDYYKIHARRDERPW
jgi:hypothetical protein